jgi:hypothetical protein
MYFGLKLENILQKSLIRDFSKALFCISDIGKVDCFSILRQLRNDVIASLPAGQAGSPVFWDDEAIS